MKKVVVQAVRTITAINDPLIDNLLHLRATQANKILIEGEHSINLALHANLCQEIYTLDDHKWRASEIDNLFIINPKIAKKLSRHKSPSRDFAVVDYIKIAKKSQCQKVIYLDGLQDPGNVGTIIRTAAAFKFDEVWFSESTVKPWHHKVIQASQGACFDIVTKVVTLSQGEYDKFQIISTMPHENSTITFAQFKQPFIIVFGNEGTGINEATKQVANENISINMPGEFESLNVAQAATIIMYEVSKVVA